MSSQLTCRGSRETGSISWRTEVEITFFNEVPQAPIERTARMEWAGDRRRPFSQSPVGSLYPCSFFAAATGTPARRSAAAVRFKETCFWM